MKFRNPLIARDGPPVTLNTRAARWGAVAVLLAILIIAAPVATGWWQARGDAAELAARADALVAQGQGPDDLGPGSWDRILMVQDPGFAEHSGVDLSTPGAGITTVTQSLAKRVAFDDFQPGWAKLRQTGYAMGLETRLTKPQIAALWLETVEIGRVDGSWTIGFFDGVRGLHGVAPRSLSDAELADVTARLIAPGELGDDAQARGVRAARILRLWSGECVPDDHGDVWLEGCA